MGLQYRQGDVLFERADEPDHLIPVRGWDGVIVRGEATGHAHRLADLAAGFLEERDGTFYLRVRAPVARIVHEEHKPVELPQGVYKVVRQREWTDFSWADHVRD